MALRWCQVCTGLGKTSTALILSENGLAISFPLGAVSDPDATLTKPKTPDLGRLRGNKEHAREFHKSKSFSVLGLRDAPLGKA